MSSSNVCAHKDICVIPQLNTNPSFEEEVCNTKEHINCVDFIGRVWPEKGRIEWKRIKEWLLKERKKRGLE